jgi:uncharacterized protein YqhQ
VSDRNAGLTARRDAPLGGQAVLEGVMMRGVSHWAVAVRALAPAGDAGAGDRSPAEVADQAADSTITVKEFELAPPRHKRIYRLPVIRGVVALVGSLAIGMRALAISANMAVGAQGEEVSSGVWTAAVVIAIVFAVGLFFVAPVTLTSLVKGQLGSSWLFWLVEGLVRVAIFLGYLVLISRMRDMRRVLEYHGAEHKVISCYEAGDELTPERAALYSRLHPRCGTSFLLVVMLVAIVVFAPIGLPAWWVLVITRVLGVPLIAGLSFELIKWAGRNRRKPWVKAIMYPGMSLQKLTTREPDLGQLAVSIAALSAVLAHETPGLLSADDLVGLEVVA